METLAEKITRQRAEAAALTTVTTNLRLWIAELDWALQDLPIDYPKMDKLKAALHAMDAVTD